MSTCNLKGIVCSDKPTKNDSAHINSVSSREGWCFHHASSDKSTTGLTLKAEKNKSINVALMMSNPTCWAQLSFCVTFLSLAGYVSLLCVHRSPITTLHQPPSQPLWWDSLWRPLSPTTMPKSPLEHPRSPACRLACDKGLLFKFSTATHVTNVWTSCLCLLGFLSYSSSCQQRGWSRRKSQLNTWSSNPPSTVWCSAAS